MSKPPPLPPSIRKRAAPKEVVLDGADLLEEVVEAPPEPAANRKRKRTQLGMAAQDDTVTPARPSAQKRAQDIMQVVETGPQPGKKADGKPVDRPAVLKPLPGEAAAREKVEKDKLAAGEAKVMDGRRFGRFELLLEMARGGMATLYLARIRGPSNFEKFVAIKKIHDHLTEESEFVEMFLDEARISAMIHHPNVAQIYDMGNIDNAYFIAMEYVHGQDLSQMLRQVLRTHNKIYNWSYAARIVADAASGLHAAHELKSPDGTSLDLVHRDVSPQNILVSYDGHTKVVDFGIAYAAEKISQTGVGTLKGKAPYMSPEQSRGKQVDRRSDVFALGILLFESVCMKRLFREETEAATLMRVGAADVPRPRNIRPDIPPEVEKIILKALAREPENRFQSASELARALEQLLVAKGRVVGPDEISGLMSSLFHDRKRIRDSQIQEVSKRPSTNVGMAIGMSTTTVTQLGGVDAEERPKRRWVLPAVLGAVAVAAIAVAVILGLPYLTGNRGTTGPARKAPPPPMTAASPMTPAMVQVVQPVRADAAVEKKKVLVEFEVQPASAKAMILFRGKEYRQNRLELLAEPQDAAEVVRIEAPGYQSLTEHITVNAQVKLKHVFRLKPVVGRIRRPMGPDDDLKMLPD